MRERGFYAEVVERWNPWARIRVDLFGFLDVLCLGDGELVGVQSCSLGDISKRIKKIADHPNLAHVRKAGIRILVQGWKTRKVKGSRKHEIKFREVDVS
jgi:hypothetical protein